MISRRTFAATIVPAIGIPRQIAFAQLPRKAYQVGVLATVPTAAQTPFLDVLRTGLRDLGYVEGRNFVLVVRCPSSPGRWSRSTSMLSSPQENPGSWLPNELQRLSQSSSRRPAIPWGRGTLLVSPGRAVT
jgi:hypothetical protein